MSANPSDWADGLCMLGFNGRIERRPSTSGPMGLTYTWRGIKPSGESGTADIMVSEAAFRYGMHEVEEETYRRLCMTVADGNLGLKLHVECLRRLRRLEELVSS